MKTFLRSAVVLSVLLSVVAAPGAVFADEGLFAEEQLNIGSVATAAVTGPITVGDITYVPGPPTGGGMATIDQGRPSGHAGPYPNGVIQTLILNLLR